MKIGGLQKLSLIDYPGKTAATVFLIGCNFKCGYCQNPELIDIKKQSVIDQIDFFKFLDSRKDLIDGVCITGGEPTINSDLLDFIKKIKEKGFLVKLDTNGSNPELLEKLINYVDFVAMDIKINIPGFNKKTTEKSIKLIKNSNIDYEFRITVVPKLIKKKDIEEIGKWLKGIKKFALQQFQNKKVLDKAFKKIKPYSEKILKDFEKILRKYIKDVEVRL